MILEKINSPDDLKNLSIEEMNLLAEEVRAYMLGVVSRSGGHLASSLGVVELTIALHRVFNTPFDKIIWDVGHQTYAHKILTGRREQFRDMRQYGGISGFPKRNESPYDAYNAGHSSTSISLAVGEAVGRDLQGGDYKVAAVIGDGSLTGGIAFEALNHIGHIGNDVIIILNDNELSISENVGALSTYLTEMISRSLYNRIRKRSMIMVKSIPFAGKHIYNFLIRLTGSFKSLIIPGQLFENMGIRYFGPVDGHNIPKLIEILDRVKRINSGPKLVHIITKKGKGFIPAEDDPCSFHGTGPFCTDTGERARGNACESYSSVAGRTLAWIAGQDKQVTAVTAAMKEGTGLSAFEKAAPERLYDVGIAEQHAVTFSAALASTGLKPFVCIYSTFLQRAYDQLIHDVAIMNLPVKFLIDRAGIVGEDGETHHGVFDVAMIRSIPNFIFLAPSNGAELRDMICFAWKYNRGPVAIRYPRGTVEVPCVDVENPADFIPGKIKVLAHGSDLAIIAVGDMVNTALELNRMLGSNGYNVSIVNLLTIKPVDMQGIADVIKGTEFFITLENGIIDGGIGEYIYANLDPELSCRRLFSGGFPDEFVTHGKANQLYRDYGIDPDELYKRITAAIPDKKVLKKIDAVS